MGGIERALLQHIHIYLIQAFFLCLSATFVIAYYFSSHRGTLTRLVITSDRDRIYLAAILIAGGMISRQQIALHVPAMHVSHQGEGYGRNLGCLSLMRWSPAWLQASCSHTPAYHS
jgi:hypothetical protein